MQDLLQFALVFCAIGIGWFLGRHSERLGDDGIARAPETAAERQLKGLNYLLNEKPDHEIDAFIDALEINVDTLETHLAVGTQLRKRGEVERAIRVHQNLLGGATLPDKQRFTVFLELARDYIHAGLLDRAERLLLDTAEQSVDLRDTALEHLMEIYQREKEWSAAVEIGEKLLPRKAWLRAGTDHEEWIARRVAHYRCELAGEAQARNDVQGARQQLKKALEHDRDCVRASLALGQLELATGHPRNALKVLKVVAQQDATFLPDALTELQEAYSQTEGEQAFLAFLQQCYQRKPGSHLLMAVVDLQRKLEGEEAARMALAAALRKRPTLKGLAYALSFSESREQPSEEGSIDVLADVLERLIAQKPVYQCGHCGFSGKRLHWLCPACEHWGSISPVQGIEGE